jgi:hypothetical protein
MSIIKINMSDNKIVTVLVVRPRVKTTTRMAYVQLIKSLFEIMTDAQIESIIKYYPKPVILMDDILNCFHYKGIIKEQCKNTCICGVKILHNHIISNDETDEEFIIGSTCCEQWNRRSIHSYTIPAKLKTLKMCFNALKLNWNSYPKFRFGKYADLSISKAIHHDINYCKWIMKMSKVSALFKRHLQLAIIENKIAPRKFHITYCACGKEYLMNRIKHERSKRHQEYLASEWEYTWH